MEINLQLIVFPKAGSHSGLLQQGSLPEQASNFTCWNCCLLSVAMVKGWHKTDTKKETIFSEQIYKKRKKKKYRGQRGHGEEWGKLKGL